MCICICISMCVCDMCVCVCVCVFDMCVSRNPYILQVASACVRAFSLVFQRSVALLTSSKFQSHGNSRILHFMRAKD